MEQPRAHAPVLNPTTLPELNADGCVTMGLWLSDEGCLGHHCSSGLLKRGTAMVRGRSFFTVESALYLSTGEMPLAVPSCN